MDDYNGLIQDGLVFGEMWTRNTSTEIGLSVCPIQETHLVLESEPGGKLCRK